MLLTACNLPTQLVDPALFPNAAAINAAIHDVVALLRVPRASLGLACSSRGAVAGLVQVREGPSSAWVDCARLSMAGWAIPGELAVVERLSFR
jgi:DNA topoisomerase VI subunit A